MSEYGKQLPPSDADHAFADKNKLVFVAEPYLRSSTILATLRSAQSRAETAEAKLAASEKALRESENTNAQMIEALTWALAKEPSPCRCIRFSTPTHVCVAHKALATAYDAKRKDAGL